jgi:hypothetical protein
MANVYLIAGFNNWGKTHLINGLFRRQRFSKSDPAQFNGTQFCVVPQSNDDLGQAGYIFAVQERLSSFRQKGHRVTHVVSAFCPTREPVNDSLAIINRLFRNDRVFLIPIEYKWCGHARLQIKEITSYLGQPNVSVHPLVQRDPSRKLAALENLLVPLL